MAADRRAPAAAATEKPMETDDESIPTRVQPWLGMVKRSLTILVLALSLLRALGIV